LSDVPKGRRSPYDELLVLASGMGVGQALWVVVVRRLRPVNDRALTYSYSYDGSKSVSKLTPPNGATFIYPISNMWLHNLERSLRRSSRSRLRPRAAHRPP